jgi:carbon-monoxide dehydrogenase large subunit
LIDLAAREHGFDRIELRRRNLISNPPHTNPLGITYDGGAYRTAMDNALALADWEGFPTRRREALGRGKRRGFALANYIEITTGVPRERAEIVVRPDGWVDLTIGTLSSGQGHETSFAQLVTEWLGVPFERVRFIQGDTDRVPVGGGTQSGRSMRLAGIVIGRVRDAILQRGRAIAAEVLETSPADLVFAEGGFTVQGTDRSVSLFEIARAALERHDLPEALKGPLAAEHDETVTAAGFPYGTAVCEVEADPETGHIDLVRYAAVDDVGRAINPMILEGQAHGGIAQGVGQALLEQSAYDRQDGQLLAGSFMDYAMPRADTLPSFVTALSEVPSPSNPLGIRAGGEGGTTPALAVVINAIVDALAEFGVRHIEMPATPERVWRAIRDAQAEPAGGAGRSRSGSGSVRPSSI